MQCCQDLNTFAAMPLRLSHSSVYGVLLSFCALFYSVGSERTNPGPDSEVVRSFFSSLSRSPGCPAFVRIANVAGVRLTTVMSGAAAAATLATFLSIDLFEGVKGFGVSIGGLLFAQGSPDGELYSVGASLAPQAPGRFVPALAGFGSSGQRVVIPPRLGREPRAAWSDLPVRHA